MVAATFGENLGHPMPKQGNDSSPGKPGAAGNIPSFYDLSN